MLEGLCEKTTRTTARIIDGLANLRVDNFYHCPNDLARREELAAVVSFLAHLQEQTFIHLGDCEDVGGIDIFVADLVHAIEHVEKVALGIDARSIHARHNLADDFLPRRGVWLIFQFLEMRDELAIYETEKCAER